MHSSVYPARDDAGGSPLDGNMWPGDFRAFCGASPGELVARGLSLLLGGSPRVRRAAGPGMVTAASRLGVA